MAFDPEGVGHEEVNIDQLTSMVFLLQECAASLGEPYMDAYGQMLQQASDLAVAQLGSLVCGVEASFCVAVDVISKTATDVLTDGAAKFIGLFQRLTAVKAPLTAFELPETTASSKLTPALLFKTVDANDVPTLDRDDYNTVAQLFPYIAVPMLATPVFLERLPVGRTWD